MMDLTREEQASRDALKARQGKGARYDAPNAPAGDLLLARRGTAYFARKLTELTDAALYDPSKLPGKSRAFVVAEIGYQARHQALALEALMRGETYVPVSSGEDQLPQIELAVTLPARALRFLIHHSTVHLNICWRDLNDAQWEQPVTLPDGTWSAARDLPKLRARNIWQAAIDLGNGARKSDIPVVLREH